MTGIYMIKNYVNQKVYIGQTIDFEKRFKEHKNSLIANRHINQHLQNAWNKYGEHNFEFIILEKCNDDMNYLTEREQYWINYYGGVDSNNTYNTREAGNRGTFSKETCYRISNNLKGHKVSDETRLKISKSSCGRHHTQETIEKIKQNHSHYNKGRKMSDEQKQKLSKALKGRSIPHKGHEITPDTRKKISQKLTGIKRKKWTQEQKDAQSKRLKGKPAWNKGIPSQYKGVPISEETREKIRIAIRDAKGYKVAQYDLDNNLINIFESTMDADRKTGVCNAGISACCRGLQKTSGGYIWKKYFG